MDVKQINEIRSQVKIPNQLMDAASRIVKAGQKVMFSKETRKMVMDALQGDAPVEQRIGKAISDLMVLLWMQSNKSMPPQLVMPCAVLLTCDAVEFMMEAGEQVDVGQAMEIAVTMTLERFGVKPDQLESELQKLNKDSVGQLTAMPAKGAASAPQQQQAPGMIGG